MEARKKVVIIGSAYPLRGGLSNFNERLAEEFLSSGYDIIIYTFSLQYPAFLFPGKTQMNTEVYKGHVNIEVIINSINPLNWIKVGLKLKNLKPDLIIVKFWIPFMSPCFGTILRIAGLNKETTRITIIDNIIPHEKRPFDNLLIRYFTSSIDGFITMSRNVLEQISLFDKAKPRIFSPHPIYDNFGATLSRNEAIEFLRFDHSKKYILFFGFIRDYKGLDILLEAMTDERIKKRGIVLIVAGEFYCDPAKYTNFINENNLHDFVILRTDFIPDSEVNKYFCACDVVVQPYKSATQSGVTQIAYHFNKPMIITNVGGLEEFVPDGKVGIVVSQDPAEVANAIVKFYDNELSVEFCRNIESEKLRFSWSNFLKSIKNLQSQITRE